MGADLRTSARSGGSPWSDGVRQPLVRGRGALSISRGSAVARSSRAFWRLEEYASPLQSLGREGRLAEGLHLSGGGRRQRIRDDRQHDRARPSAQRGGQKKDGGDDQAIGRSRGGLSTKIHTLVDALGNPVGFLLTGGQAHDLIGADHLLPTMAADTLLADKAYDADERVLNRLESAGKTAVIPPKANRIEPREYDKDLYKARHLIENFFAKLKQFRAIATRYDKLARNFLAGVHLAAVATWLK
jgi:transposase